MIAQFFYQNSGEYLAAYLYYCHRSDTTESSLQPPHRVFSVLLRDKSSVFDAGGIDVPDICWVARVIIVSVIRLSAFCLHDFRVVFLVEVEFTFLKGGHLRQIAFFPVSTFVRLKVGLNVLVVVVITDSSRVALVIVVVSAHLEECFFL